MPPTIPFPELTRRYVQLKDVTSEGRLRAAERATVHEHAALIGDSVRAFEDFDVTIHEPFYPANDARDLDKSPKQASRTFGWAMAIKAMSSVSVEGDESLTFRYVAREVSPVHTKPMGTFETPDGKANSTDLILINESSSRPVVAEVKIGRDKEPYTALVQALASAAQLVPRRQRARLQALDGRFASFDRDPRIDVFVLLAEFPERNRHRWYQLAYARGLAAGLEAHPDVQRHFGRITFLQLHRSSTDEVSATTALPQVAEEPT